MTATLIFWAYLAGYLPAARWFRRRWLSEQHRLLESDRGPVPAPVVTWMAFAAALFWLPALLVTVFIVYPVVYEGSYRALPGRAYDQALRRITGRYRPAPAPSALPVSPPPERTAGRWDWGHR
jgi:RsiW-degrading membrane proteinase PrsW (M82 family)